MLNDRSSILSLLASRRSAKPRDLVEPGPDGPQLGQILTIASRTPDHGKLSPWRFVVVDRAQREMLARLLVQALEREETDAPAAKIQKARDFAHHPGALVVLLSSPVPAHKIPLWEQELSCGAAAMNLLLAAHAMGFVGGWVTGWAAYSPTVAGAFCSPGERIAGFLFLGTSGHALEERARPPLDQVSRRWEPPVN